MSVEAVAPENPLAGHLGWWFPRGYVGKCHWAQPDGRSLCGRYGSVGVPPEAFTREPGNADPKQDCAACRRKLDKLRGVA